MKTLVLLFFIFSSPVISEINNLDKTFLQITINCKKFRIFDSEEKSSEVEKDCIAIKLEENNLSKTQYEHWNNEYYKKQTKVWNKFFKNLEENG